MRRRGLLRRAPPPNRGVRPARRTRIPAPDDELFLDRSRPCPDGPRNAGERVNAPGPAAPDHGFTLRARIGLTLIAGGAVANIYYNQPLLAVLVAEFGDRAALLVPTACLVGYGLGILGLVPLGDTWPRRTLIVAQMIGLSVALLGAALSTNLTLLTTACLFIGFLSSAAQQAVPFAAELAPDATRGRIVGQVMTGLLSGILLARTVSGFVGAQFGWRAVFFAAALVALAIAGVAAATLPKTKQTKPLRYRSLMLSILHLVKTQPVLRNASLSQGLLFASFNAFWATLALLVEAPPFDLTAAGAGLFGVIGVCGAFVAPLSGRYTDRKGARPVVVAGGAFVLASFVVLGLGGSVSLVAVGIGVLLIDIGLNGALIANQTRAYALVPGARGRINTVLFTVMFVFGALGAFAGSQAFLMAGWPGVCLVGGLLSGAGLLVAIFDRSRNATGAKTV